MRCRRLVEDEHESCDGAVCKKIKQPGGRSFYEKGERCGCGTKLLRKVQKESGCVRERDIILDVAVCDLILPPGRMNGVTRGNAKPLCRRRTGSK
jgi:hypothetical protein